ncbi:MAG: C25 family peptidase propeptide domain-containing protein [Bacteroidota bacterium]|nr:C25 family peptidase propeptide domain-containing protein [Bacteroidota bacterium]
MKKLCLLSVALMITTFCQSQGTWIQFTDPSPQEPEVQLITSSNSTVQFQVEFFGMYSEDIAEQGDTYQRLSIPGCRTTIEMGEPELPYLRKLIAIPECSGIQPSISVTSGSTLTGDYLVYPAPDHTVQTDANGNKYVEEVFSKDQSFYNTDQVNPVVDAEIVGTGYMRGQRFAEVYIYPVLYNPYDEEITANYTYTITLSFTSPTSNVNEDVGIFNNVAGESFINYTSDGTSAQINDMVFNQGMVNWYTLTTTSDAENIYADYLIITDEDYWTPQDQNAEDKSISSTSCLL